MEKAVGARGWVVLHNREPLSLPASDRSGFSTGNGWLKLRAAPGVSPVIVVEIKGQRPFLTVGSGMSLVLEGLTIVARYTDQSPGNGVGPPPTILAAGPVRVTQCAFLLEGTAGPPGSCAITVDGGNLTVENSWFKGFDTALDVRAIGNSTTTLRQTMTIGGALRSAAPAPASSGPDQAAARGWGIRMQFHGGRRAGIARKLLLDHCTATGAGLLQISGFTPEFPLQVQAQGCAVQAGALIAWEPVIPEAAMNPQTLQWQGDGNQLDITGPSWIVPAGKGTPIPQTGIVDRQGWSRIAKDRSPVLGEIQFLNGSGTSPEKPDPEDFTIKGDGVEKVGADPKQVGPKSLLSRSKS